MEKSIIFGLREALLARGPLAALPEPVWKRTSALNTWGTNALEGNTLGRQDVERLLLAEMVSAGASARDVMETIQHDRAFRRLAFHLDKPLTAKFALGLHEKVFENIKPHAGSWRLILVGIYGTDFVPPDPAEVPLLMDAWEREYHQRDFAGEDAIDLAAWMHWRFEAIHPFTDGNGRIGRLMLNFHLLKKNWPPAHVLPPDKETYLRGLEAGHRGDLGPLQRSLEGAVSRSLLDFLHQVGTHDDRLVSLEDLARDGTYAPKYLASRARHGFFPAVKIKGDWQSSKRALLLYEKSTG